MTDQFHTLEISDVQPGLDTLRMVTVKSRALKRRADITVWVPQVEPIKGLLILLHGVWGSHWVWSMKGGVHRTAQRLLAAGEISPMVIAMPSDGLLRDGSAYLDWPGGENVERWIVDEVPAAAALAAPAISAGTPVAIGGLSMGGYGALRLGAKYSNRFCAISAHSAITEVSEFAHFVEEPLSEYRSVGTPDELSPLYLLRTAGRDLPALRFDCGVDDSLIYGNRALHESLRRDGVPHEYTEHPGGHDWAYWQRYVADTVRFADRQFSAALERDAHLT